MLPMTNTKTQNGKRIQSQKRFGTVDTCNYNRRQQMAISNEQLAAAIKAAEDAAKLVMELKEQSRAEDLKTVKELIALHGFLQKDLTPELKTRGIAKKVIAPKKTAGRSKAK
jgi:hypothetical protein